MLRADAIVVLGCRILPSGRLGAAAARRVAAAASAYQAGVAPRILASGGRRWGEYVEARAFRQELAEAGVPEEAAIEELCSLSTFENAIFSAALLRRLPGVSRVPRAVIVTCPFHMPRALADFRRAGVDAEPFPSHRAPSSMARRAYLNAHEIVCGWLDARAMRKASLPGALVEHAERHAAGVRSALTLRPEFAPSAAIEAPRAAAIEMPRSAALDAL
jgi:uncharacterized SAM-binding protein YcdF (DUF218 family)